MEKIYYFDNVSTTMPHVDVLAKFVELSTSYPGHPDAVNSYGSQARAQLELYRTNICRDLQLNNHEIVFTSGGTEANNLAIIGYANNFQTKKHFITTEIEHSSVYYAFKHLEEIGHEVTYLKVDKAGQISLHDLSLAIKKNTVMVSLMVVNNEIGTTHDLKAIKKELLAHPRIILMTDCVQGLSKVASENWNFADLITISGHKIFGLKGVGALLVKKSLNLNPLFKSSLTDNKYRPGYTSVALAGSLAKAIEINLQNRKAEDVINNMHNYLRAQLEKLSEVTIITPLSHYAPGLINISINNVKSQIIVNALAQHNIIVSASSACSGKSAKPSRVVKCLGYSDSQAEGTIRIAFDHTISQSAIDYLVEKLTQVITNYRGGK